MRWVCLAITALSLAACGGGDRRQLRTPSPAARATPAAEPVTRDEVRVIRSWADALRRGHIAAAARWFALPSLVSNNTVPLRLKTRADVRVFNATLPCGAKLMSTERAVHRFVIATFKLTERPGGSCSGGAGNLARTAFLIRHHRIAQWLRVPDPAPGSTPEGSSPSA